MNFWKPLALVSMSSLVVMVGYQAAHASPSNPAPSVSAQPHMEAAMAALKTARHELDSAEHNKGGWRDAAVKDTEAAIADTKRGIEFAGH